MKNNLKNLTIGSFTFLGIMCITSGLAMPKLIVSSEKSEVVKLSVTQKQVSVCKSNEIKLADIILELNNPLSTNAKDYLKNPDDIETSIINRLKLDTSNVNTTEVGNYTYTITNNKKIYNGNVIVKAKPLPQVETMNLKALSYEINSVLPINVSNYIVETLQPEVLAATTIDLSNVDTTKAGSYLYSISYNRKLYTSTITIYEPNKNIESNSKKVKDIKDEK